MDVPYYNKGRTVADVPLRSWVDGTRERLRPDTLYADITISLKKKLLQLVKELKREDNLIQNQELHSQHMIEPMKFLLDKSHSIQYDYDRNINIYRKIKIIY